ncbi:beta-ketoacyl synthase N-terminal-like domain-containing protein [Sulfurospirillum barnesii]|uniref:Beta-ketoacyl synthase family protein,phosphopantetheine-containing protein n=1 Tax=Sulfurospirillum barnesii (strain ATCC 700032 / DSM 10660 / SES-3) TaxID=760154 RepID=I3XVT0_SULBS|nr:beta-ketoacyl synthase N-terminal-like domain-containing protein [Sulfurospirillum barnesii]AFL68054.1 beta-ketoacyl synthase family protein,phosphopantetheine-containing protein [Sulfurospirillum barnesii SES-3]
MKKKLDLKNAIKPDIEIKSEALKGDVAVVGIGIRVGDIVGPEDFFDALLRQREFVKKPSWQRMKDTEVFAETSSQEFAELAYIEEHDRFDNRFFKIPPHKAELMDPQEKILLQCAVEAAEDAGLGGDALSGTKTVVFAGGMGSFFVYENALKDMSDVNTLLELLTPSMSAARIAHFMNLKGGATVVDTACSSSLAAIFYAYRAVASGEYSAAFAVASKLILKPFAYSGVEIASKDGRTRAFDKEASGTGGGEAAAAVVLKSLERALSDGDDIYAVIKAGSLNHNGFSVNITAPDAKAQTELITSAWRNAQIKPEEINFIEAHGTATKIGDAIEIEALNAAFRRYTDKKAFCTVGSVKSNVGHTDNAAGIVGFIKAVLSVKNRIYPATVHFNEPHPAVDFNGSPVYATGVNVPLQSPIITAGVSAFGLSGTNVHMVLQNAPQKKQLPRPLPPYIFALSAKTEISLDMLIQKWAKSKLNAYHPADISATLLHGRGHYEVRVAFVFNTSEELLEKLQKLTTKEPCDVFQGVHSIVKDVRNLKEGALSVEKAKEIGHAMKNALKQGDFESALALYVKGAEPSFDGVFKDAYTSKLHLPVYAFEATRRWFSHQKEVRFSLSGTDRVTTGVFTVFRSFISFTSDSLVGEHSVGDKCVMPASGIIDQIFDAAEKHYGHLEYRIEALKLLTFLEIPKEGSSEVVIHVSTTQDAEECSLMQNIGGSWKVCAQWRMHKGKSLPLKSKETDIENRYPEKYFSKERFANQMGGVVVSDKWNCIEYAGKRGESAASILQVPRDDRSFSGAFLFYPPMADAALNFHPEAKNGIPASFGRIEFFKPLGTACLSFAKLKEKSDKYVVLSIVITDNNGEPCVVIDDYTLRLSTSEGYLHKKVWNSLGKIAPKVFEDVFVFEESDAEKPLFQERLKQIYSVASVRIVYKVNTLNKPEKTLRTLFDFLCSLSKMEGKIELIISADERTHLLHGAMAAMGRTFEFEHPCARFRFVETYEESINLFDVFHFQGFRFRVSNGTLQRLEIEECGIGQGLELKNGGQYLITGGLGGLGLFTAEYVSKKVDCAFVLMSRSGFAPQDEWNYLSELKGISADIIEKIQKVKNNHCSVTIFKGDVSLERDLARLKEQFGHFDGIFHAAGSATERFFIKNDLNAFLRTVLPKVRGTLNVLEMFQDTGFFLLFSSLSGLTSAPGQAGYCAANAFMDSLAEDMPEKILSVGWPRWSEVGMAIGLTSKGDDYEAINLKEASRILDILPAGGYVAVGKSHAPLRPLLEEASVLKSSLVASAKTKMSKSVELTGAESFTHMQIDIGTIWAGELGYETIDIYEDYEDLGGDSIASLSIHEKLEKSLGISLSFSELFENKTIATMAQYLEQKIHQKNKPTKEDNILVLRQKGERKIICFPPGTVMGNVYAGVATALSGYAVYALNYIQSKNPPELFADMTESVQPEGELILLGYSVGGNLAYETAKVLEKRGRRIRALIFLDNFRRLELFEQSDEAYQRGAREYLSILEKTQGSDLDKEEILARIEHYDRFIDSRREQDLISAPIYLIKAEKSAANAPMKISQDAWGELTTHFEIFQGDGKHMEMLFGEYFEKNIEIIRSILNTLK